MIENIIHDYVNENRGIEELCSKYRLGKVKIKHILIENNVELKKRGGQKKIIETPLKHDLNGKSLSCKICKKTFNDIENRSGSITSHIRECYPEIEIPSKLKRSNYKKINGEFWHFKYFDIIDSKIREVLVCPECNWETTDINNTTGSLTKHIVNHGFSINEFIERHENYRKYFNPFNKREDIIKQQTDERNFVTCKLCEKKLKIISNTHLKNEHGIDRQEYCKMYPNENIISFELYERFKKTLLNCSSSFKFRSNQQIEIENFLSENGIEFSSCNKKILNGIELDIFIPKYNIAIEYNGLFWHSEKQGKNKFYHIDKTKKCLEKNIRLIHIFEDDWLNKREIIKNRLSNLLKINQEQIYARKCLIRTINTQEKSIFLDKNHIQGNDKSSIHIGLEYNGKIVSVMTFGKERVVMGNKNQKEGVFELFRFSSLNVVGGFSKLLKYFIKNYNPQKIITYADRNWSPGNEFCFYGKMGFSFVKETPPNYYYMFKYKKREHRFNYRKDRLIKEGYDPNKTEREIMFERGFDMIWDTGNLKYEMLL